MADLLNPKVVIVEDRHENKIEYVVGQFPAIEGREIAAKYPTSIAALAKQWEENQYAENEKIMLKAMGYVERVYPDGNIRLTTMALVDNHVPDAEALMRLEKELLEHNFSFFAKFMSSISSGGMLQNIIKLVTSTLTHSLQQSSKQTKQP
ncbi:tail assembly chaperone protein [Yersinia phage vB_YenM_P744]